MANSPLLSICIPAYNYGNYVDKTIASCLASNFDFELIVLDNCSTDNTPEIKKLFEHDPRLHWYRNSVLLPVQENWNKAVSLANGKYIKLLQADDLLLENFFELFERVISIYPNFGIYGHLATIIDENGNEIRKQTEYGNLSYYSLIGDLAIRLKLNNISRFKEPSCNFFLKDSWINIGGYRSDMRFTFDISFNTRIAFQFGGVLINDYAAAVRRHKNSDGAKLPASVAVEDLNKFTRESLSLLGCNLTKKDINAADSLIQYRVIELFLQRINQSPISSIKFLWKNKGIFKKVNAYRITLSTICRKFITGDVQNKFEKFI